MTKIHITVGLVGTFIIIWLTSWITLTTITEWARVDGELIEMRRVIQSQDRELTRLHGRLDSHNDAIKHLSRLVMN